MLEIIKVTGESLSPFFLSGDYVLIHKSPRAYQRLEPGDIVVADHPVLGTLIKKVRGNLPDQGRVILEGTHPGSISSQKIGEIPYQVLRGKVIFHFKRPR